MLSCKFFRKSDLIFHNQDLREAARKKQAYHEKQNAVVGDMGPRRGEIIPFRQAQGG